MTRPIDLEMLDLTRGNLSSDLSGQLAQLTLDLTNSGFPCVFLDQGEKRFVTQQHLTVPEAILLFLSSREQIALRDLELFGLGVP